VQPALDLPADSFVTVKVNENLQVTVKYPYMET